MNNPVPHFYYSENKLEAPGAGFIVSTFSPHYLIGKVIKFDSRSDFNRFTQGKSAKDYAQVPGYLIVVQTWNVKNNTSISMKENLAAITNEINEMAQFYLDHTVKPKEGYYKRYSDKETQ